MMLVVAGGVLAVSAAGCGIFGRGTEDEDLPLPVAPVVLTSNGMEIRWQTRALLTPGTHLVDLWVRGGFLVCHGSDHRVYVIDAKTGVRLWSKDLADVHEAVWPPAVYKGDLWFATTTRLIGFHGADGTNIVVQTERGKREAKQDARRKRREKWEKDKGAMRIEHPDETPEHRVARAKAEAQIAQQVATETMLETLTVDREGVELEFAPAGPPATNGVYVYVPDGKGWLQAVLVVPNVAYVRGGEELNRVERDERLVSWGRWTGDAVTAGPVVDNAFVYFGGRNGVVYASRQNVRRVEWEYQTEGSIVGDLKRTETGRILAASLDYSLYAFRGTSGQRDWRYDAGERIRRAPYAFGNQVFAFTQQAGLTALDSSAKGKMQWRLAEGDDIITADAETVYVLSRGNDLLAVGRADGKVRWGAPLRRRGLIGTNETNTGVLYLATPEGQVLAAAKKQEAGQGAGEKAAEAKAAEAKAAEAKAAEAKPPAP